MAQILYELQRATKSSFESPWTIEGTQIAWMSESVLNPSPRQGSSCHISAPLYTVSSLVLQKGMSPINPVCLSCSLSFSFLTEWKPHHNFTRIKIHEWSRNYKCPNPDKSAHKNFQPTAGPQYWCWYTAIEELTKQLLSWKPRLWSRSKATAERHSIPEVTPFYIKHEENKKAKSTLGVSQQEQTLLYSLGHQPVLRLYFFGC